MKILGISSHYHDAAAALVIDGMPVAAVQEERLSRRKNDAAFPLAAIEYCLEQHGLEPDDLDAVVFYERPMLKFDRILTCALRAFPKSWRSFPHAMKNSLGEKLWVRGIISSHLEVDRRKILFTEHHRSHAAAAFLTAPVRDAAILTADGVGEWAALTVGHGTRRPDKTAITLLREIRFPHSLGMLYSTFTAYLGFQVNEGEYKVMGLASYGRPTMADAVRKIVELGVDGLVLPPPLCDDMEAMEVLWNAQIPALSFASADPRSYSSSVSIDDFEGARSLARHLLTLGHREIAFVRGDPLHSTARAREEGFRAAMAEAGVPPKDDLMANGDFTYRSGLSVGRELLERKARARPTAVFASNDDMAAAILAVAHGLGIRVPGELSVAGFDDTPIASTVWPQLTTIHQPLAQMASTAVEILFEMARQRRTGERVETHHRRCDFSLQVRGSTARLDA